MTLNRRSLLSGLVGAAGAAGLHCLPRFAFAAEGEIVFKLPAQSSWSTAQTEGHERVMKKFRQCRVLLRHRSKLFEGLVYAVSRGHREAEPIQQCAAEYLQKRYAEIPDWLKITALVLQIIVAIVTILLLFI